MHHADMKNFCQKIWPQNRTYLFILLTYLVTHSEAATIGWFYALNEDKVEFERIVGAPIRTATIGGESIVYDYRVGRHRVIAAKMGSGCVQTAVTTARVLTSYQVDRVLSTGPAGCLQKPGDMGKWFRVEKVIPWQKGSMKDNRLLPGADSERPVNFAADAWPRGGWTEAAPARLISGEVFVACSGERSRLAAEFRAELIEMNAFGLLAAVEGLEKPVLILRVASDRADDQAGEDFAAFVKGYDGTGGKWVAEIVRSLPVGQDEPEAHEGLKRLMERGAAAEGE